MPLIDARPDAVDKLIRPGVTYVLTLPWPAGALAGRSFSSTLAGEALALTVVGDTMTIEAPDTITAALEVGVPVPWLLLEDIDGTDEPILVGTWTPSDSPRATSSSSVSVTVGGATVEVTVNSAQASVAALDARLDTAEGEIDALQAADVVLDGRLDAVEAGAISLDSRLDVAEADIDAIQALDVTQNARLDAAEAHAAESSGGGAHGLVVHRWAVDGWTPFSERFVVTADGAQANTLSVAGRRGRVTASAATNGNFREWFLHEATAWADGEISGILYPPSNWDTGPPINRPQHGFVCRAQEVSPGTWRAFVVWLDMAFGTSGMLANTWQADGVTLTQGTQNPGDFTGPSLNLVRRQLHIRYARRINAFDVAQYWAQADARSPDMWGLVNGDLVNIASMGDTSFNRTGVAADNVSTTTKLFQVADTTANDNIDAIAGGTVDFVSLRKQMFPRHMAVMLEGDELHAKHWRPEEPEPDWGDGTHVATLTPPSAPALPEGPGLWGVLAGHVHSSSWLEYGDLTFRRR